nr:hypothetical protein F38E1.1 - Caenorhabditis elegans [Caenorhabditis elegans]
MLESLNDWTKSIDLGEQIDIIYLDFSKAFDRLPHDLLLDKLVSLRMNNNLLIWLNEFLSNRSFRVRIGQTLSSRKLATCGVPQGAVLSPLLFGIYVNDISSILPKKVACKQFADDTKLYVSTPKTESENNLQSALDAVVDWTRGSKLTLNQSKTVHVTVGKRRTDFHLDGYPIERKAITRDLGFLISEKLDFSEHWRKCINLAKFQLANMFNQYSTSNKKLMILLYKTFIRPR